MPAHTRARLSRAEKLEMAVSLKKLCYTNIEDTSLTTAGMEIAVLLIKVQ